MKTFFLLLLGVWYARAVAAVLGQLETNLTLFYISPCNGTSVDNVSRLKDDVYAVLPDFSKCNLNVSDGTFNNNFYGFRVASWANVSTSDHDYSHNSVIFITRQANPGVISWNIPLLPQGFTSHFYHVNRTMCPSNTTQVKNKEEKRKMYQDEEMSPAEEYDQFLFFVDVFSNSIEPIQYSISVEVVPNFLLELDRQIVARVGAASPQIYYFKFPEDCKTVTVEATTDSDICAFVSVQNNTCPVNDLLENARSRGIYQTMSKSAFLTVEVEHVTNNEFVLVIITTNYSYCHSQDFETPKPAKGLGEELKFEQNITVVIRKVKPTGDFIVAILFPFSVLFLYLAVVCIYSFLLPRIYFTIKWKKTGKFFDLDFRYDCPLSREGRKEYVSIFCTFPANDDYNELPKEPTGLSSLSPPSTLMRDTCNSGFDNGSLSPNGNSGSTNSAIEESTRSIVLEPDESKHTLPRMCKIKFHKLDKQYSVYSWNTVTVGIFYALPAVQLVIAEQQVLNTSGDQDKCYYNFKCAHPLGVLSAFNNQWSNLGYVLLGLLFLVILSIRKRLYLKQRERDKEYVDSHGIPQFYGIYQAMGIALILEGFMSAFYHICPTNANFQFDTAFMFIIGGLFLVKILQNRHPDINANAFIAFFSFAVIIFITLIGIYLDKGNTVIVRITIFSFILLLVFVFFFSFYRFHLWTPGLWASFKGVFKECFTRPIIKHKCRFCKLFLTFICNLLLALCVVIWNSIDIATSILAFFVTNLMLFLIFYVIQKFMYSEPFSCHNIVLAFLAIGLWSSAFYFFIIRATSNWELTPAESRAKNKPCAFLDFYDYHDIWHFFSASALFFSFLFLLTLDDGIQDLNREDIRVF